MRGLEVAAVPAPVGGGGVADVCAVLGDAELAVERGHDLLGELLPCGAGDGAATEHVHLDVGGRLVVGAAEIDRHIVLERAHEPAFGLAGHGGDRLAIGGLERLALLLGGLHGDVGVNDGHGFLLVMVDAVAVQSIAAGSENSHPRVL